MAWAAAQFGTPIVMSGRVVTLVRRSQASGFQDTFVVAVEASTGRPLWRRHVSSAVTSSWPLASLGTTSTCAPQNSAARR